ncbi:hypothetical protein KR018_010853 [Drosophila ironensis]|nr:hypothetical protein KR018_010853 [Drosophila ironensis]
MSDANNFGFGRMEDQLVECKRYPPPYEANGRTLLAIRRDYFVLVDSDTRDVVYIRIERMLFQLTDPPLLGSTFCWVHTLNLTGLKASQISNYQLQHTIVSSTNAIAQRFSITMYNHSSFFSDLLENFLDSFDQDGADIVNTFTFAHTYTRALATMSREAMVRPVLRQAVCTRGWISKSNRRTVTRRGRRYL